MKHCGNKLIYVYLISVWCRNPSPCCFCPFGCTFMSSWVSRRGKEMQSSPGNRDGLELSAAFRHCLHHSVSFSADSQVGTRVLHVAACRRFRWFSERSTGSEPLNWHRGHFVRSRGVVYPPVVNQLLHRPFEQTPLFMFDLKSGHVFVC